MPKIGPYSERDLAEKLTKIPEPEMLAYYKLRMKRYHLDQDSRSYHHQRRRQHLKRLGKYLVSMHPYLLLTLT